MRKFTWVILITTLTISLSFSQEKPRRTQYHAFSGTLQLGIEGGATFGGTDYSEIRPDILGRGSLEYFFPTTSNGIFSLRGFVSSGYVGGKDEAETPTEFRSTLFSLGGGVSYTFSIQDAVFPFLFVGASGTWFSPKDVDGNILGPRTYDVTEANFHGDLGVRFLLSDEINLSVSVGGQVSPHDYWDNQNKGGDNDFLVHTLVGMSYSFFTRVDTDEDGIPDDEDQCPNTPQDQNIIVDEFGCPVDSDGDGVPDYLDKCPNTPTAMEVDEFGCVKDADSDGVPDKIDKCPNTPKGKEVNEEGCPDSDSDGVYDNLDKCPDTPAGAPVENDGCPKDSDGDGVPDYKDECPNTPAGTQVDEVGCAKADTVAVTLRGDTNFEFNRAELLPAAYPILNDLAATMKRDAKSRWRIEGHADAIGSDSYNMDLSRSRAESVANYLVTQGIDRSRLDVVPYGESMPVATNDTQEGRAMNRRVEIKMIK
jgi:OOP family OmpA-OmpF porin